MEPGSELEPRPVDEPAEATRASPDAGDEAGLSTALGEMLDTLETYDRAAIVRHAQRYSFAAVGDMLDSIYQEVSCN